MADKTIVRRTLIITCRWPRALCDRLNRESGEVYSRVLVEHWRRVRRHGVWLPEYDARRLDDYLHRDWPHILGSNSIDQAQRAVFKAFKTIRATRKNGNPKARYPRKRKRYRATAWNGEWNVRVEDGRLRLSMARDHGPLYHPLPDGLDGRIRQVSLVWDRNKYVLHLSCEYEREIPDPPGDGVLAIDLGEIHPAVAFDGEEAAIFTCRGLRSNTQYRHKRLAALSSKMAPKRRGSRKRRRLANRKYRFLSDCDYRQRDMLHKISRAVVDYAVERKIGTIVVGDLRDLERGKRLNRTSQQKISSWPRGKLVEYIRYKAEEVSIDVTQIDERGTSSTCPRCGARVRPGGRRFACSVCGFREHRDIVGAMNIHQKYRSSLSGYERSPVVHGQVARRDDSRRGTSSVNPARRVVRPWVG